MRSLAGCSPVVVINVLADAHTKEEDYTRVQSAFSVSFSITLWLHSTACTNRVLLALADPPVQPLAPKVIHISRAHARSLNMYV